MIVLTFDRALAALDAEAFVRDILVGRLDIAGAVVGYDFHFGAKRAGSPTFLRDAGSRYGFAVDIVERIVADANGSLDAVSSTQTREALQRGDVETATRLLGHPWFVEGTIVHGRKVGRDLGFPTANIALDPSCRLRHGVYAVRMRVDGVTRDGVASFGTRPVFDNGPPLLEVYLLDFAGDLYGKAVEVAFVGFIRGEANFASIEALVERMHEDVRRRGISCALRLSENKLPSVSRAARRLVRIAGAYRQPCAGGLASADNFAGRSMMAHAAKTPGRGKIYASITETIGDTPLVRLDKLAAEKGVHANLLAKLEFFNPLSSVKDRIGVAMIEGMEADGRITPGTTTLIEPTSGNTGIALAFVAAAKGYKLILVMPDSMSIERRKMLAILGAELVLTPAANGMKGAIAKAGELLTQTHGAVMAQQFENPANPDVHRRTTAEEIWNDTAGEIDYFVAGVGTGGTITGVGEVLKPRRPGLKVVAVEPTDSPMLSEGRAGPHKIQGIGAGFVPTILDTKIIDEVIQVSNDDSFETARPSGKTRGHPRRHLFRGGGGRRTADRHAAGGEGQEHRHHHPLVCRAVPFDRAVRQRVRTKAASERMARPRHRRQVRRSRHAVSPGARRALDRGAHLRRDIMDAYSFESGMTD